LGVAVAVNSVISAPSVAARLGRPLHRREVEDQHGRAVGMERFGLQILRRIGATHLAQGPHHLTPEHRLTAARGSYSVARPARFRR